MLWREKGPFSLQAVQDVGDHFHGSADGDGDDDDVGPSDAVFVADDLVHQADGTGRLRRYRVAFYAQSTRSESAPFQVQRHGAPDKPQSDYSNRSHTTCHSERSEESSHTPSPA